MDRHAMTRREFFKASAVLAGALLLSRFVGTSVAAPVGQPRKMAAARPPRTCGGWIDQNGNGACDRSEKGSGGCQSRQCPGSLVNPKRQALAKAGAPAGVCAAWEDPGRRGFCGGQRPRRQRLRIRDLSGAPKPRRRFINTRVNAPFVRRSLV